MPYRVIVKRMYVNNYFALRHGESRANVANIIVSDPRDGERGEYTLTAKGEKQIIAAVEQAKSKNILDESTVIYASPFSRCKRSAEIARELLLVKDEVHFDDRLRERWFGAWEKTNTANYEKIWSVDYNRTGYEEHDAESADHVRERAVFLIEELEKTYARKNILLVSHGDVLQILQTTFLIRPATDHRMIDGLRTGELRQLNNFE
jgi:broad specificity phosphatase PhoE